MSKLVTKERVVGAIVSLALLAGGAMGARALIRARKPPESKPVVRLGPLVDVMTIARGPGQIRVMAQGTVVPAKQVAIQPEIVGRIVQVGPAIVPGGRVAKEDLIVRIDARDYRLAVDQRRAAVERATYQLDVERGRKVIAEREWKLLGSQVEADEHGRALALREPQIRNAQAELAAARSVLRRARLNVERARIVAPFNAVVRNEAVEMGQVVQPGKPIATLVGTDQFWVQVSVPTADLIWIQTPGARATIRLRLGDEGGSPALVREGRVVQLLSDLDPVGRLARLLVEIDDPLGLKGDARPLLLGSYVEVEIAGQRLDDVVELPRVVLRADDKIWVVDKADKLAIRSVEVLYRMRDSVILRGGVAAGDSVVRSRLAAPVVGMSVRRNKPTPSVAHAASDTEARQ